MAKSKIKNTNTRLSTVATKAVPVRDAKSLYTAVD